MDTRPLNKHERSLMIMAFGFGFVLSNQVGNKGDPADYLTELEVYLDRFTVLSSDGDIRWEQK